MKSDNCKDHPKRKSNYYCLSPSCRKYPILCILCL